MILIVDDFRDGATAFCAMLKIDGYPCDWVGSGQEAISAIRAQPPEQPLLVVLDEMMPEMSGIELLRVLRADPRLATTPVLFLSAGFDLAKRDEAMTLGALAWLLKGGIDVRSVVREVAAWYERIGGVKQNARTSSAASPPPASPAENDRSR
jgi:CheY-like chemotaxis protein